MHMTGLIFACLSALAIASPVNIARQDGNNSIPPFPVGTGTAPSGLDTPPNVPRPTAVPVPKPVGSSTCPVDGQLVCNGPDQFGLCNWGKVQFLPVAAGTQCLDGEIVFASGFGTNA